MSSFRISLTVIMLVALAACQIAPRTPPKAAQAETDPFWRNATIYFLMTDRFANGDESNDLSVGRKDDADKLRGFEGGDIRGVTAAIESGYFNALGVDAIWTTPLIENVHGAVNEQDWGRTYAYHGYWPKDWTRVDPNFGTEAELADMINAAHERGIRVIADVIINHAGAPTEVDPVWPENWVRRGPSCSYENYAANVPCELSFTLQDILTESETSTPLPGFLIEKWRREGRLEQELAELDAFFARTGYPRAPKYYIVKWLTDWVREYGIDGFRVDTAKHTEAGVWAVLKKEATLALEEWRASHPGQSPGDETFYMVGEVFDYGLDGFANAVSDSRAYNYGDRQVDFFDFGFDALINMGFPTQAKQSPEALFQQYADEYERGAFVGKSMVNYITSHDDMNPFDPDRTKTFESAMKLMLAPGAVQIYYGDEVGRPLTIAGTKGDTTLRSKMDWAAAPSPEGVELLDYWRMLGSFRKAHPAIGAGAHIVISRNPYVFARHLKTDTGDDRVVVAIDLPAGLAAIPIGGIFDEGVAIRDIVSGAEGSVIDGAFKFETKGPIALIEAIH